jgi:hypothetical protein
MPGIDKNTVLCLHLDGNTVDSSPNGYNFSGGTIVTSPVVFGSGAFSFPNQGFLSSSRALSDSKFNLLRSGDSCRTIDLWVRFNSFSGEQVIYSNQSNVTIQSNHVELALINNTIRFYSVKSAGVEISIQTPDLVTPGILVQDQYHHLLFYKQGSIHAFYIDGQQVSYTVSSGVATTRNTVAFGWSGYATQKNLNAYLDEIRIYDGGNYFGLNPSVDTTDSFIVPTAPYAPRIPGKLVIDKLNPQRFRIDSSIPSKLKIYEELF